jgi:hypothetical protein
VLGLSGDAGDGFLMGFVAIVLFILFWVPLPPSESDNRSNVLRSFLLGLQLAGVAWLSVVGTSWSIARWARSDGSLVATRSAYQLVVDWQNGVRPVDGIQPYQVSAGPPLHGSYIVHASRNNGQWLVPLNDVVGESVTSSMTSLRYVLSILGALVGIIAFLLQLFIHSDRGILRQPEP